MNRLKGTGAPVARQLFAAPTLLLALICFATAAHGQEPSSQSGGGAGATEGGDLIPVIPSLIRNPLFGK